jgi:gliding motility-associated-like protein
MKAYKLLFILFICFNSISVFSQTADNTDGCYPLTVNFTSNDNTTNWDFGDGSVSELKKPSHIYTKAGSYNVKLNGNTVFTVNVFQKPEITLTATPTKGCTPLFVTYTLNTKSPLPSNFSFDLNNINWNFQDGNSTKNTLSTTYAYNTSGQFDIGTSVGFLYNNNPIPSCGSSPLFEKIVRTSSIFPSFSTTPPSASSCIVPLDISFKNTSTTSGNTTSSWDFGNGNNSTKLDGEPQQYTKEGQFPVKLTVKDSICTKEITRIISIGKPKSDFSVPNNNDTICSNIYTSLKNKSTNGEYKWVFDNTATPSTSIDFEPSVKYSSPGKHIVKLITIANGCSDTLTKSIFVEDSILQILSTPSYSCNDTVTFFYSTKSNPNLGKINSYSWTFPYNGKPSSTTVAKPSCFYNTFDSTYHFRKINTQEVTLNAITKAGCYLKKDKKIDTIHEVWARFVPDKTDGCLPLVINFGDSSMTHPKDPNKKLDSWFWDFGDGTNSSIAGSQSHTYSTPGIYHPKLIVKDLQSNCIDTSYSVEIRVGDKQNISFDVSPTTICPGDKITLTNTSQSSVLNNITSWHYSSDKELLSHCGNIDNLSTTLNDTIGNHTITLTGEYNGCYSVSQISKTIQVNGAIASFDYLQDCKTPNIIKLINKAQGSTNTQWVINNTVVNALADTTTIDLSTLTPVIPTGDVKIKMIASGSTCSVNSDSTFIHYGTIKSVFHVEDDKNKTLAPIPPSTKILVGDASTGSKYVFNATNSQDINPNDCYRGYSFLQESDRPNTYNNPKDTFLLSKKTNNNKAEDQVIKMVVRNANNCVDTSEINIRIFNLKPDFNLYIKDKKTNADKSVTKVCLPTTLYFNEMSIADTTIKDWYWQFSDGGFYSGKTPPNHEFTNATGNSVSITLTVTDINGFKKSKTQVLPIYKPKAYITSDKVIDPNTNTLYICENETIKFNSNSIVGTDLESEWTFVNTNLKKAGNPISSNPWKVRTGFSDNDTVILKITEPSTGCVNDTSVYINIEKYPNTSLLTDIKNNTACASESTSGTKSYNSNFSTDITKNPIGTSVLWDLGYNNSVSSNESPSLSYPIGTYTVKLTLTTPNQCKKDSSFTFKVIEKPTGAFTAGPTTICKSESVTFEITKKSAEATSFKWDFDDGNIDSTNTKITHQYNILPPSGKVTAKLIVINGVCPSDPITKDIFIKYVKADFNTFDVSEGENDDTICFGDKYNFINTSTSANQFKWIYDQNNQTSTSKDINNIQFNSTGTKTVSLIVSNNDNACKDTLTKTIYVKPLPKVEGVEQIICFGKGQSIKLETKDTLANIVYTWNKKELSPSKTDTYIVTAKDTIDHCSNTDDVLMVVIQPIEHIDWDTTIVIGDAIKLPINNQYNTINFEWIPKEGLSCTDCSYPTVRPLADTTYKLIMKDQLNCFNETGVFKIIVKPDTYIKLPTTFTPNGDGNNDILYVRGWGIKELVSFEIYNRWGALIFQTNDINTGWNGYYKDEIQNSEVYVYKVTAKSWLDKEISKQGYVNLLR